MRYYYRLLVAVAFGLPIASTGASAQQHTTGLILLDPTQYQGIPLTTKPLQGTLPAEVDLSSKFPVPGTQGRQGACVGWSTSYLKTYQAEIKKSWGVSAIQHQFSPAFIFNQGSSGNRVGGFGGS
jgi:hypothetical protein